MSLLLTIEHDLVSAMKDRRTADVSTLRLVKSVLQNAAIALRPQELSPADEIKTLRFEVKKRLEAIEAYRAGHRPDLAAQEEAEIVMIKKYLPAEMGEPELRRLLSEAISTAGATSARDFGKVMGLATKAVAGRADGQTVSRLLKELLPSG